MSIASFLKLLEFLAPMIVSLLEHLHPAPGSGKEKMAHALDIVERVVSNAPTLVGDVVALRDAARPIIQNAVDVMNGAKEPVAAAVNTAPGSLDSNAVPVGGAAA